jgi:cell division protein FtsL
MSTVIDGARVRARPRRQTRAATKPRSTSNARGLSGGVLWIVLFALLLAGVVAVNVAVLRLNLQLDGAGRERTELEADLARLKSELSTASATPRIERLATTELGLQQADPDDTVYVRIRK